MEGGGGGGVCFIFLFSVCLVCTMYHWHLLFLCHIRWNWLTTSYKLSCIRNCLVHFPFMTRSKHCESRQVVWKIVIASNVFKVLIKLISYLLIFTSVSSATFISLTLVLVQEIRVVLSTLSTHLRLSFYYASRNTTGTWLAEMGLCYVCWSLGGLLSVYHFSSKTLLAGLFSQTFQPVSFSSYLAWW